MAEKLFTHPGRYTSENTFTQLVAPGVTAAYETKGLLHHTFLATVAAIDTNVIVEIEGSNDGTNWFDIPLDSTAVTTGAITTNRLTITANGTFVLAAKNFPAQNMRFRFVSESGGTAATIDVVYYGGY